jgi:hypothetical protein
VLSFRRDTDPEANNETHRTFFESKLREEGLVLERDDGAEVSFLKIWLTDDDVRFKYAEELKFALPIKVSILVCYTR